MKHLRVFLLVGALFFPGMLVQPAQAVLTLELQSGADTVSLTDGQPGDLFPGVITFMGSVGVFSLNLTMGITDSANPTHGLIMDLMSYNSSTAPGTLKITLQDTGLVSLTTPLTFLSGIGGTSLNSSLSYSLLVNGLEILSGGPLSGLAFSEIKSGTASIGTPYSMTLITTLVASGASTTSYDWQIVPEPSAMLLVGAGLIGLATWSRWRSSR